MKKISSLMWAIALILTIRSGLGQGKDGGPIGFVNAVGSTTKTDLQIDGRSLKPSGFPAGGYASGFALAEGNHQFVCSNDAFEKASSAIQVSAGSSPLYVLYKVAMPQRDGTVKNALKLTGIPPQAGGAGVHFLVFSTLEGRRATLKINGTPVSIDPLRVTPLEGHSLNVESEGRPSLVSSPREAGTYALILFDGADSRLQWALVEMAR